MLKTMLLLSAHSSGTMSAKTDCRTGCVWGPSLAGTVHITVYKRVPYGVRSHHTTKAGNRNYFCKIFANLTFLCIFNLEKETPGNKENYQQYINNILIFLFLNRKQFSQSKDLSSSPSHWWIADVHRNSVRNRISSYWSFPT